MWRKNLAEASYIENSLSIIDHYLWVKSLRTAPQVSNVGLIIYSLHINDIDELKTNALNLKMMSNAAELLSP